MKVIFIGTTHAPRTLAYAAQRKGFTLVDEVFKADLIFVSQDAPTAKDGTRDLTEIEKMTRHAVETARGRPVIVTSQVTPGWSRFMNLPIYHQIETLRIVDAMERAMDPEMHVIGCADPRKALPADYQTYLNAWSCPKFRMSYEEAEFTKIAINTFLASQVDTTNKLSEAATRHAANWETIALALRWDKRIGQYAYLKPGRWQDSTHLLRDAVTLDSL
jgi:UDPglucose 6-dehydrogenase